MSPFSPEAIELLRVINHYGNPLDMTGRHDLAMQTKTLARALIADGFLSGPMSRVMLTKKGVEALKDAPQ